MLDAFGAYQRYLALKLHFTTDYDIKKTRGRVNAKRTAFMKRKDTLVFFRLSKRYPNEKDLIQFLVANFIAGDKYGGLYSAESTEIYNAWKARTESLSYRFKSDIEQLYQLCEFPNSEEEFFDRLTDKEDGRHPLILRAYLGQNIMLETLVILERCVRLISYLDTTLAEDVFWKEVSTLINNYKPFLRVDIERCNTIIKTLIKEG